MKKVVQLGKLIYFSIKISTFQAINQSLKVKVLHGFLRSEHIKDIGAFEETSQPTMDWTLLVFYPLIYT